MNRRFFLKSGGIALASVGVMQSVPSFLQRTALAEGLSQTAGRRKTLIAIFQRGAVDGLNMVVPFGESEYYSLRPSLAIAKPKGAGDSREAAIDLDGFSVCTRRSQDSSLCGTRSAWRLFMQRGRQTLRVRTSMRRIIWNRPRRAGRERPMAGLIAICNQSLNRRLRRFAPSR